MSKPDKNKDNKAKRKRSYWWIKVFFLTLVLSFAFTLASKAVVTEKTHFAVAAAVLVFFIVMNIMCDILGTAITTCEPEPFQSMAARKIKGAKTALRILKNAEKFDSVINDVIGDICAIICGATGAALAVKLVEKYGLGSTEMWWIIGLSALTAALMIGGKAFFKKIAITKSRPIVFFFARAAAVFFHENKKTKPRKKEPPTVNENGTDN